MRTDSLFGFAALYRAWRACRRGKRGTRQAQRYEIRLLDHLVDTAHRLRQGLWRPSRASRFVVRHPKPREILAAEFGDRVVHHWLVPWFEQRFEPVFIHDSFANRRGKGTHAAVARLRHFLRGHGGRYYLQLDIHNFFNSINRRILFGLLRDRVRRDQKRPRSDPRHASSAEAGPMLGLARVLLTGNPAQGAVFRGHPDDLARVPAHKQLANAAPETGLPIGNLTSQFFANVYLNELDQFVKHTLKARAYIRYVDDFLLLHDDPGQLVAWRTAISDFLKERLRLTLRDEGRLAPVANGIDFLGYVTRPDYCLVRRRVIGHLRARLDAYQQSFARDRGRLWRFASPEVAALQATLASYFAHFRHARTGGLVAALFRRHAWLADVLEPLHDRDGWIVRRVDWPTRVSSLASQWRYFRARYPRHSLLVQVGNRLEAWGPDAAALAHRVWGGRPVRRPGLGIGLAWPIARGRWLRGRLRRLGQPFCQIVEDGWLPGGMKRRRLEWVYRPAGPAPRATERQVVSGKVHRVNEREGIMNRMKRGVWIGALAVIGWGGAPGISQAVQCHNNLPPSNPDAVYQDHGNGTVTDTRTGLMWKQCSEGQSWSPGACSGTPSRFIWSQALAWAETATFAGHADWRVPNVKELSSLVEDCRVGPAINDVLFPNTPSSHFWSASPYADHSSYAWLVYFFNGFAYYYSRSYVNHVRLVRGGQ